ncbi:hypothetical protein [Companilactobacillus sp.]|uniref:hypothetical protein n=1 Tax=Companilactobacillus sp. TaxID=2767905 RepID=UPI0026204F66|nr:hypothetical protein [Companilactobacillus sp.]
MYDWLIKKILGVSVVDEYKKSMVGKIFTVTLSVALPIIFFSTWIASNFTTDGTTIAAMVMVEICATYLFITFLIMKFRLDIRDRDPHYYRRTIMLTVLLMVIMLIEGIVQHYSWQVIAFGVVFIGIIFPILEIPLHNLRNRNDRI